MKLLFSVETERLALALHGPEPEALPGVRPGPGRLGLRRDRRGAQVSVRTLRGPDDLPRPPPRLFEETEYQLLVRSKTEAPVSLSLRDPALLTGLASLDQGRTLAGPLSFGTQVGRIQLALAVGGEPELTVETEIFPTKLDYATDFRRLLAELHEIVTGLALEYLRATWLPGMPRPASRPGQVEWLTLLEAVIGRLERALAWIADRPHRALVRQPREIRPERVRRIDAELRTQLRRRTAEGRPLTRSPLVERRARPTLDTPEHRWLATRIAAIARRLAELARGLRDRPAPPEDAGSSAALRQARTLVGLAALERRLACLARLGPLAEAVGPPPPGFASLTLLTAPGYREAYRACQILLLGLELDGDALRLTLKDLHALYEQWAFLALVRALAASLGTGLPARDLLRMRGTTLELVLSRGRTTRVELEAPDGRKVRMTHQPRPGVPGLPLPKNPDALLEIEILGRPPTRFAFEAAYRVEASAATRARYGLPGPPDEVVARLHRYRDALLEAAPGGGLVRTVLEAVAFYPLGEEDAAGYAGSPLALALARTGVGAIPFLPGATGAAEAWLTARLAPEVGYHRGPEGHP